MSDNTIKRPVPPVPPKLLTQWVWAVLVAIATGVGLKEAFHPTLTALIGGGAGIIASYLVEWIRVWSYDAVSRVANRTDWHGSYGRWFSYWLYNPRGIRGTVLAVTLLIGAASAGALDWASGKPLNLAVASAWAFIGSQVAHLRSLPGQPATMDPSPIDKSDVDVGTSPPAPEVNS